MVLTHKKRKLNIFKSDALEMFVLNELMDVHIIYLQTIAIFSLAKFISYLIVYNSHTSYFVVWQLPTT